MDKSYIKGAETISLFCRLNINGKKALPIRSSEVGLLILSLRSEMPITPVMAADFFKVKKPMITTMVHSLSRQEYLKKVSSATDKRSFTLKPTEKAVSLIKEIEDDYFSVMDLLKKQMGKDYDTLLRLLESANKIILEDRSNG